MAYVKASDTKIVHYRGLGVTGHRSSSAAQAAHELGDGRPASGGLVSARRARRRVGQPGVLCLVSGVWMGRRLYGSCGVPH